MERTSASGMGGSAGNNPFFKTVNNGYGESWQASNGVDPR